MSFFLLQVFGWSASVVCACYTWAGFAGESKEPQDQLLHRLRPPLLGPVVGALAHGPEARQKLALGAPGACHRKGGSVRSYDLGKTTESASGFCPDFDGSVLQDPISPIPPLFPELGGLDHRQDGDQQTGQDIQPPISLAKAQRLAKKQNRCEQCGYITGNKSNFNRHVKTHQLEKQQYRCQQCGYITDKKGNFNRHSVVHLSKEERAKRLRCLQCDYVACWPRQLDLHMKGHKSAEHMFRSFQCNQCNYTTDDKSCLSKHMRTHLLADERPKPLQCHQCSYATDYKHKFNQHIRTHLPAGERPKPLLCHQCCYATDRMDVLARHMNTHISARERFKPFRCEQCSYATDCRSSLKRHLKVHIADEGEVSKSRPVNKIVVNPRPTGRAEVTEKGQIQAHRTKPWPGGVVVQILTNLRPGVGGPGIVNRKTLLP